MSLLCLVVHDAVAAAVAAAVATVDVANANADVNAVVFSWCNIAVVDAVVAALLLLSLR